ncbi:MAG: hypothetical protein ACRD0A_04470 [Acidimicrobiales bacterium]
MTGRPHPPRDRRPATGGAAAPRQACAALYTAKGGQGCTTTAVALALVVGRSRRVALVAHNPADVLAIAGQVPVDGTSSTPLAAGATLVLDPPSGAPVVIHDAGPTLDTGLLPAGTATYLVTRPCFLALRAAVEHPVHPAGVIVIHEPGRAITAHDIEAVLDAPVVATIPVSPAISRRVDAGLLAATLPPAMATALQPLAGAVGLKPRPVRQPTFHPRTPPTLGATRHW